MTSCAFHICKHPAVYRRLQDEIDKFYEDNKLVEPISYIQAQEMPYLKAVVSESLRMSPPIPFQLLRYSLEGGMTIEGHYIPAGSEIGISAMAQNRDTAVFGKDADDFRPERYLESSERNSIMESSLMTWGGNGPRNCIGRNIALVR
jgi:cytochrome P450